jgi:hypothetical protein
LFAISNHRKLANCNYFVVHTICPAIVVNGWPPHGPKGDAKLWPPYRLEIIGPRPWPPYRLAIIGPKPNKNTTATIVIQLKVSEFEFIYVLMALKIDMYLAPIS